jgi:TorA maturation chaperone TorD
MVGDRDLLAFRRGYYDLFVSLLWKEPPRDLLAALAEAIQERIRAARGLHPLLAEGWEEIHRFLEETHPDGLDETVREEYTRLFLGPHGPEVNPYESFYLTGRLWDRPLAALRTFLKGIGIEKQEGYAEPEDFLTFEMEVMRRLIGSQGSARDPDGQARWLNAQAAFLREHLLVWGPAAARDLTSARGADFYRAVGKALQGFLELERELFKSWGPMEIKTLEEARQRFAGAGDWRGPLFEIPGDPTPEGEAPAE